MGVNAAVAEQSHKMDSLAMGAGIVDEFEQLRSILQAVIVDGLIDANQILSHGPSRSQIEVPHLAISTDPRGQSDCSSPAVEGGKWIVFEELVEVGGLGIANGILVDILTDS